MNNIKKLIIIVIAVVFATFSEYNSITAQHRILLNLQRTIEIASDSSLQAFRAQHLYMSGYWEYRSFRAGRLPSLSLNLTPASYNRYITQRYN